MNATFSASATVTDRDSMLAAITAIGQAAEDESIGAAARRLLAASDAGAQGVGGSVTLTVSRGSNGATPAHDCVVLTLDLGEIP